MRGFLGLFVCINLIILGGCGSDNNGNASNSSSSSSSSSSLVTSSSSSSASIPGCESEQITPYLQINNAEWQAVGVATFNVGDTLMLGPHPKGDGIWSWSGCGASGSSREQTLSPVESCTATGRYTNSCGAESKFDFVFTVASIIGSSSSSSNSSSSSSLGAQTGKQMEFLSRGLVAVAVDGGVYLSWRFLGTDDESITFNLYRDGKVVASSIEATNYQDTQGGVNSSYTLKSNLSGNENTEAVVTVQANAFFTVDLERPAGGTTPSGEDYTYTPNDASVADLDGDGEYEIILKWDPTNAHDNAHDGYTGNVYIDAYEFSGQKLWRIDLGRNIRAGAHYTQFMAYDFDGDGRAEVAMKTADGTIDGRGAVIGSANADYRSTAGRVLSGPEFFTVFNGQTGANMKTIDYPNTRGNIQDWGDNYGNRSDRFLAGVAYLDGKRPSMIFSRGYYEKAVISALDWRDNKLTLRWKFTADSNQNQTYRGQGAHSLSIADVDGDERDEIIFGAATIDDNGTGLYSTQLCHGDAMHVTDIDPNRPGQEVFMVHESPGCYGNHGVEVHDAKTGQILYSNDGGAADVGRGVAIDVDPNYPGVEVFGSRGGTMTTTGERFSYTPGSNFAVWWDGDLLREILDGTKIDKWDYNAKKSNRLLTAYNFGAEQNNGTKATPALSADLFGDWREEVIWRHNNNHQLVVFTTTIPTDHRIYTLMHDPQYRVAIAWQNTAYNQPPHPSFFLGANMAKLAKPNIYTVLAK